MCSAHAFAFVIQFSIIIIFDILLCGSFYGWLNDCRMTYELFPTSTQQIQLCWHSILRTALCGMLIFILKWDMYTHKMSIRKLSYAQVACVCVSTSIMSINELSGATEVKHILFVLSTPGQNHLYKTIVHCKQYVHDSMAKINWISRHPSIQPQWQQQCSQLHNG